MDEFTSLRALLPQRPAPGPEVIEAARTRMLQADSPRRVVRGGHQRRAALRVGLPVTAVCAAGTAAALLLTAGQPPVVGHPAAGGLTVFAVPAGARTAGALGSRAAARQVLLTAAQTVAQGRAAASGRWWEIPALAGNVIPVGHVHDRYLILEKTVNDQFMASSRHASSPQVVGERGVQLASAANRDAWVRAGSPTRWRVNQEFGLANPLGPSASEHYDVAVGSGRLFALDSSSGTQEFPIGDTFLSYRQLMNLPASPRLLRKLLLRGYQPGPLGGVSSYLFQTAPTVLDLPVTPAVRAALYRMLAELRGVRSAGQVTDVAGQRGPAVSLTQKFRHCGVYGWPKVVGTNTRIVKARIKGKVVRAKMMTGGKVVGGWMFSSCTVQQRLVISSATGLPIAQELRYVKLPLGQHWSAPGGLFSYEVFGTPKWTNALPALDPHGR
ncbi:MAG TPA: hypothetical protein VMR14_05700 [Streptosporangiaceae bacterium]|jgi:hypothetical protein|nr:hypothetical protein [Streptosporangiaceae bacterium]